MLLCKLQLVAASRSYICNDSSLIVVPTDKGRATVVMDRQAYDSKVTDMLSDLSTYDPVVKDPAAALQTRMNALLLSLRPSNHISQQLYDCLRCSAGRIPFCMPSPKSINHGQNPPPPPPQTNSIICAFPAHLVATTSSRPACHTASLHVSLESGSLKNTCPMVNSVAVRWMGREAARTMASSAEPYRKGFVSYNQCSKGRYCQYIHVQNKLKRAWYHCFADVTLTISREALYMPRLLGGCIPKHSTALFIPKELKGDLPGRPSRILLLPLAEGDGLPPFICQIAERKLNPSRASCTSSANLLKTASASSTDTTLRSSPPDLKSNTNGCT